jgi:hypothetical protein
MARQYVNGKITWRQRGRCWGDTAMNLQKHHVIVGLIAIVVAFALAANYYLW